MTDPLRDDFDAVLADIRSYSQWLANGRVHGTPWRTARDGDPIPKLEREWRRYRS